MAITLHERLSHSCELLQPALLHDHGEYASISVPGMAEEIYSPELTRKDFLAIPPSAKGKLVKLLLESGFRNWPDRNAEDTTPRVETIGRGPCPTVQEGLRAFSEQLDQRRRAIQSKVYQSSAIDGVVPARAIFPQRPSSDLSMSGPTVPPASSKTNTKKYKGNVELEFIVGPDGSVSNVKVVHSATRELDEKATAVARGLKFKPARKNGMPVSFLIHLELQFNLY